MCLNRVYAGGVQKSMSEIESLVLREHWLFTSHLEVLNVEYYRVCALSM